MYVEFRYLVCAFLVFNLEGSFGYIKERRQLSTLYRKNLKQMVDMLDEDVDPCGDFFQHACGYYEQTLSYASDQGEGFDDSSAPVPPMLYNLEDRMHFFYEQHENFNGTQVGKFLGQLYTECRRLKRSAAAKEPIKLWRHIVRQLPLLASDREVYRAWPYLHYQWSALKASGFEPNWAKLAGKLAAHGVETNFLQVFFAEHTIYVAPPESVPNCGNFTQIRDNLRPLMSGRNGQIADIIGHELFMLCDALNIGEVEANAAVQMDNGTDLLRDDILSNYFLEYFAHLNFTESEVFEARKVLLDVNRINELMRLFRETNERVIYNYLLWRTYDAFKLTLVDCFSLTDEFESMLLAEYWQWNVFEQYFQRDVALATYMFHTTRFQQLRKSELIAANWAAIFLETGGLDGNDFNLQHLITAYADEWLAPQTQTVYETLEWRQGAFFANLLQMRRLKLRATFKQPHQDVDEPDHPHYFLRTFLYFSILIIKEPLFHYFATQDFDLWHTSKLLYSTDGYYTALDCLEQQSRLNMDEATSDPVSLFHILSEEEVLRIFNFHRAFMASLRDYQFWLQGEFFAFAEDFVLQFFELNSQRIMFYAAAQQYCGRNDELYGGLINRSFMNVQEFEGAFNCTAEAPMNPLFKCMINSCHDMGGVN